ncbi:transposase [Streptomyces sp. NPDC012510]|uniref:transposase n=1 Tax=Streptomyces sp. NPDC012510 TaxID=3364838 RepID=UPI0036E99C8B
MSDHVRLVLIEMITETDGLNERVRGLETTIRELVTPLAPALLEITGISHVSAAVLLAEIGDITRFTSSAKLTRYTGTAPIPVYPPTRNATGCTEAATGDSTACSTRRPSSNSDSTRAHEHFWPATSRPKEPAAPDASSNAI